MIMASTRIISRRPLILARRANDRHTERAQEAVQRVNAGAKTQIRAMPLTSIDFPFAGENDIGYRACWQMVSSQKFDRT
jgi:hypothetical protein